MIYLKLFCLLPRDFNFFSISLLKKADGCFSCRLITGHMPWRGVNSNPLHLRCRMYSLNILHHIQSVKGPDHNVFIHSYWITVRSGHRGWTFLPLLRLSGRENHVRDHQTQQKVQHATARLITPPWPMIHAVFFFKIVKII